jgi:Type I phosphodiesterase / nucleotide pyrophosphatase
MFPSITPAATASLVTGETPARHGIPGMCWYDRDAGRFVNYGQSPRAAVVQGLKRMVTDFLVNMNAHHLSREVRTLHESLNEMGRTSASINFMVFRGPFEQRLEPNLVHRLILPWRNMPDALPGPREHYFADIISGPSDACGGMLKVRGHAKRIAATDAYAACVTRDLLEQDAAELILFYLHENDHLSHEKGPRSQVDNIAEADRHVAHVLDTFGSWEETLDRVGFVVTADHSQSPVSNKKDMVVDIGEVLEEFEQARPGRRETLERRDVAVCGNGRVAFVYLDKDRRAVLRPRVIEALLGCEGVDQVMWRDGPLYHVRRDHGSMHFEHVDDEGLVDERGNRWLVRGDLRAVSGIVENNLLRTPEYPLALWRIKSALDLERIGDVVATMKLTWECKDLAGGDHRGGGDHASLHAQDSIVPFLSTLSSPPLHPATVDVAPHILNHFRRLDN